MVAGEGNGNPCHYSCLEDPMDRGAWWATVHGVARVGHDLVTKPPQIRQKKDKAVRQSPAYVQCLVGTVKGSGVSRGSGRWCQKPVFSQRGTLLPRFPPPPLQHDHIHAPTTRTAFLQLWLLFLSPVLAKHGKGCCSLMQVDHQGSFSKPTPETWLCCTDPIYLRCYSFFSSTGGAR